MTRNVLLVTCGASLLTNFVRDNKNKAGGGLKDIADKLDKLMKIDISSIEYDKARDYAYKGHDIFKALLDYLNKDDIRASAETNTINLFIRSWQLSYNDVKIYLYRSDTAVGLLVANILKEYLQQKGSEVEDVEVRGFGTAKTLNEFQEGMVDLMTKIIRIIKHNKDKGKIYVLATGGFKPETTAAIIAALLAGSNGIYYVYETSRNLVSLPGIPLSIRQDAIDMLDRIFHIKDQNKVRWQISLDELLSVDIDHSIIDELEFMGLIERRGELHNKIKLRDWVKELLIKTT